LFLELFHTSTDKDSELNRSTTFLQQAFPRDFKNIPLGTEYGTGEDEKLNKDVGK